MKLSTSLLEGLRDETGPLLPLGFPLGLAVF
jgi:hypothetical protein